MYIIIEQHAAAAAAVAATASRLARSVASRLHNIYFFQKIAKQYFKICSYTKKPILNRIKTFKIHTYNTNHTPNTKIHVQESNVVQKFIFENNETFIRISVFRTFLLPGWKLFVLTVSVIYFLTAFRH